mmetsp:Transcript_16535/g.50024  ORF Transcript_16535/g.50024 Transcript_16535/m.50024 type:complete len:221 (-) Transcript_16535:220-882(-)
MERVVVVGLQGRALPLAHDVPLLRRHRVVGARRRFDQPDGGSVFEIEVRLHGSDGVGLRGREVPGDEARHRGQVVAAPARGLFRRLDSVGVVFSGHDFQEDVLRRRVCLRGGGETFVGGAVVHHVDDGGRQAAHDVAHAQGQGVELGLERAPRLFDGDDAGGADEISAVVGVADAEGVRDFVPRHDGRRRPAHRQREFAQRPSVLRAAVQARLGVADAPI